MTAIDGELSPRGFYDGNDPTNVGTDIFSDPNIITDEIGPDTYFTKRTPTADIKTLVYAAGEQDYEPRHLSTTISEEDVATAISVMEQAFGDRSTSLASKPVETTEAATQSIANSVAELQEAQSVSSDDIATADILAALGGRPVAEQQAILDDLIVMVSPEMTDLLTDIQTLDPTQQQEYVQTIDAALEEINKPIAPETTLMLGRFASFHTRIYKNGARHLYGVTETGKKIHVKRSEYEDWFETRELMSTAISGTTKALANTEPVSPKVVKVEKKRRTATDFYAAELGRQALYDSEDFEILALTEADMYDPYDYEEDDSATTVVENSLGIDKEALDCDKPESADAEFVDDYDEPDQGPYEPLLIIDPLLDRFEALPARGKMLVGFITSAALSASIFAGYPLAKKMLNSDSGPTTHNGIVVQNQDANNSLTGTNETVQPTSPALPTVRPTDTRIKKFFGKKPIAYTGKHRIKTS